MEVFCHLKGTREKQQEWVKGNFLFLFRIGNVASMVMIQWRRKHDGARRKVNGRHDVLGA